MDKNELTKVLFPYAMEVAKTFELSEEEQKIITGEVSKFRLSEITKVNEFMNTCIRMFIQDVTKNFTIEDLAKFVNTAFNVTKQGLPGYAVKDFMSVVEKKTGDTQSTNDNHISQEKPHHNHPKKNPQVRQMSFFDDADISYIVDERPGTAHKFTNHRTSSAPRAKKHIVGNVKLYSSIDELKSCIPNVLDKDIYRIAGMLPGVREFAGIPPMYYVSTNGKNFDVARKSYREFAHMRYEIFCKAYKNIVGHAFGYSVTCKPAYKVIKKNK